MATQYHAERTPRKYRVPCLSITISFARGKRRTLILSASETTSLCPGSVCGQGNRPGPSQNQGRRESHVRLRVSSNKWHPLPRPLAAHTPPSFPVRELLNPFHLRRLTRT